ncbi:2-C-methyl-D-erythritol 2,4-cyclodiphosphate synthase [Sarracenia purpurea var. burkii]
MSNYYRPETPNQNALEAFKNFSKLPTLVVHEDDGFPQRCRKKSQNSAKQWSAIVRTCSSLPTSSLMAMVTTTLYCASPIPLSKPNTTTKPPHTLPSLSSRTSISGLSAFVPSPPPCLHRSTPRAPQSFAAAAAAAVTADSAVEAERQTTAAIPSKSLPFRVGHGFDLHRLEPGYPLIIGGINIPHDRGCEAHSDGDVLLHCVVDAILGALGLPDIGQIFPDSDPKWKGAASSVFIKEAVRLMHEAGYELGNLDATLILQRPKLSPHKEAIRANLSKLIGADPSVVNLKAKTHEKVDSLGENRSIAAHTVVLLMRK